MAVINGLPQLGGGSIVADLLWTNNSPTTPFTPKTITLSGSMQDYEYLLFEIRKMSNDTEEGRKISYCITKVENDKLMLSGVNTYYQRQISYVNNTQISIPTAKTQNTGGESSNVYIIPLRIFGLSKFKFD